MAGAVAWREGEVLDQVVDRVARVQVTVRHGRDVLVAAGAAKGLAAEGRFGADDVEPDDSRLGGAGEQAESQDKPDTPHPFRPRLFPER